MAIPKRRLRWILLIVIVVMPATLTSVVFWFVASDTWLHASSAGISRAVGMEAQLEDLALAGTNRHQLSNLRLLDEAGVEHFHFGQLDAAGFVFESEAQLLQSADWSWSLAGNTDQVLLGLMQACLATEKMTVLNLTTGRLGSLQAGIQYAADGDLTLTVSGPVDADTRAALAVALQANYFESEFPSFIFTETLFIDDLTINFNGDTLSVGWHCQFHWAGGDCELVYKDGRCELRAFKDQRLPAFNVVDGQVSLGALDFSDVRLAFNRMSQELVLHVTSTEQALSLDLLPQAESLDIRVRQAQLSHADMPWANYFDGQIAATWVPQQWDMSGSSWEWSADAERAQGALQLQAVLADEKQSIKMRGRWSFADAFQLEQVLFQLPQLSGIADLRFSDEKHFFLENVQWLQAAPLFLKTCAETAVQRFHVQQDANVMRIYFMDAQNEIQATCRSDTKGSFSYEVDQATFALVNAYADKALMASGHISDLVFQESAAGVKVIDGLVADARLIWPLDEWDVAAATLHYTRSLDKQEEWHLQAANTDWRYHVSDTEKKSQWEITVPMFDWRCIVNLGPNDMTVEIE